MFKRFGIPAMALAATLAVAAPSVTLARDRDDRGGGRGFARGGQERHEIYRGREGRDFRGYDRDRDHDRYRGGVTFGYYSAPAPAASGYYDQFGNWHPYGYYDQWGNWHAYGY